MTTINQIEDALSHISATDRNLWLKMGMAIKSDLGDQGFAIWDNWSQTAASYTEKDALATWKSIKHSGGVTIGTLFYEAQQNGYIQSCVQQTPKATQTHKAVAKPNPNTMWGHAKSCSEHAYLASKRVKNHGTKCQIADGSLCEKVFWTTNQDGVSEYLTGNLLLIPLYNINRALCGLQAIDEQGRKSFLKGMAKKGLFYPLSGGIKITPEYSGLLYIAEGFATAATIYELTDVPTIMAIDAGNLKAVALVWHQHCPQAQIIIAGDCDASGTGQRAAFEAAAPINARVVLPKFSEANQAANLPSGKLPSDFNDLYLLEGPQAITESLEAIVAIPTELYKQHSESLIKKVHSSSGSLNLICGSTLTPQPINWLWQGWLAAGKFHILAGAPGTGKTTIALNLAATITRGGVWPDGTNNGSHAGNVLIWSGEDDPKDTLLPRLIAQGADRGRIFFVSDVTEDNGCRAFNPAQDMQKLCAKALEIGLEEAKDFLRTELSKDPVPSKQLYAEAAQLGMTKGTLNRAKKDLKVVAIKEGFGDGSAWFWKLPPEDTQEHRRYSPYEDEDLR